MNIAYAAAAWVYAFKCGGSVPPVSLAICAAVQFVESFLFVFMCPLMNCFPFGQNEMRVSQNNNNYHHSENLSMQRIVLPCRHVAFQVPFFLSLEHHHQTNKLTLREKFEIRPEWSERCTIICHHRMWMLIALPPNKSPPLCGLHFIGLGRGHRPSHRHLTDHHQLNKVWLGFCLKFYF